MAVLTDTQRREIWADMMRYGGISITKTELRAAFDAVDDWFEANMAAANSAIPLPARTSLATKQKALLLALVLRKRFDVGV